jgi:hypothetical protein
VVPCGGGHGGCCGAADAGGFDDGDSLIEDDAECGVALAAREDDGVCLWGGRLEPEGNGGIAVGGPGEAFGGIEGETGGGSEADAGADDGAIRNGGGCSGGVSVRGGIGGRGADFGEVENGGEVFAVGFGGFSWSGGVGVSEMKASPKPGS